MHVPRRAGDHAHEHADRARPPVGRSRQLDSEHTQGGEDVGEDLAHDDADEGADPTGADSELRLVGAEFDGLYKINIGQTRFIDRILESVVGKTDAFRQRSTPRFEPPDHEKDPAFIGAVPTTVFAPSLFYGPHYATPCPYGCKWSGHVIAKTLSRGRVMCGLVNDEHMIGRVHWCMTHKKERDRLRNANRAYKHIHYKFVNYHPECWRLFSERYPQMMARYALLDTYRGMHYRMLGVL